MLLRSSRRSTSSSFQKRDNPGIPRAASGLYAFESGARTPVGAVAPRDTAGVVSLGAVAFAPDGDHYVFNYFRVLSELYIVDGLK